MQIHLISTGQQSPELFVNCVSSLSNQFDYIHIREKSWSAEVILDVINQLNRNGIPREKIIVNDRVDVAVTEHLGGVQLTSHSIPIEKVKLNFPQLQMGCSVHEKEEAIRKEQAGAHYLLYGHIFETSSKVGKAPKGVVALAEIIASVNIPVIAIGGIHPKNVPSIMAAGASGIAILSGVLLAKDPLVNLMAYKNMMTIKEE